MKKILILVVVSALSLAFSGESWARLSGGTLLSKAGAGKALNARGKSRRELIGILQNYGFSRNQARECVNEIGGGFSSRKGHVGAGQVTEIINRVAKLLQALGFKKEEAKNLAKKVVVKFKPGAELAGRIK